MFADLHIDRRRILTGGSALLAVTVANPGTVLGATTVEHSLTAQPGKLSIARPSGADLHLPVWGYSGNEPPRDCRRLLGLSHAAMASSSSMAL